MAAEHTSGTAYTSVLAPCSVLSDKILYCTGSWPSPEANDTIKMCKIPSGYRIVAVDYATSAKIGDATSNFKLGVSDGTVTDDDAISGAITATAAIASTHLMLADPSLTIAGTNAFTAERYVLATASAVGANPTDCTLRMVIYMSPFVA